MTTGIFTILAATSLLVFFKLGIMALVVVLMARTLSAERKFFNQQSAVALPVLNKKHG